MNTGHVEALRIRHGDADSMLRHELVRPMPDSVVCTDLKKRKLSLKDAVVRESSDSVT